MDGVQGLNSSSFIQGADCDTTHFSRRSNLKGDLDLLEHTFSRNLNMLYISRQQSSIFSIQVNLYFLTSARDDVHPQVDRRDHLGHGSRCKDLDRGLFVTRDGCLRKRGARRRAEGRCGNVRWSKGGRQNESHFGPQIIGSLRGQRDDRWQVVRWIGGRDWTRRRCTATG